MECQDLTEMQKVLVGLLFFFVFGGGWSDTDS